MGGGCVGVAMYGAVGIDLSSGCLRVILVLVPLYAQCTYQDIKWFAICWNFFLLAVKESIPKVSNKLKKKKLIKPALENIIFDVSNYIE